MRNEDRLNSGGCQTVEREEGRPLLGGLGKGSFADF